MDPPGSWLCCGTAGMLAEPREPFMVLWLG